MNAEVRNAASQLRASEPSRFSPIVFSGVISVIETAICVIVGLLLFYLYLGPDETVYLARYQIAIVLATQIHIAAFSNAGLYSLNAFRHPRQFAGRILLVWTGLFTALVVLAFLTKTSDT